MKLLELKDGQNIKALDDLFYLELDGKSNMYDPDECYLQLTGNNLKQIIKVASAGDIGIYCSEIMGIKFISDLKNKGSAPLIYYFDWDDDLDLDLNIFELIHSNI